MEDIIDENFKGLEKELGIKYNGHLVTLSDDNFFMVTSADNFNKIMKEKAEKFIKQLNKNK